MPRFPGAIRRHIEPKAFAAAAGFSFPLLLAFAYTYSAEASAVGDNCADPLTITADPPLTQAHVDFQVDHSVKWNHGACGTTANWSLVEGPESLSIDGAGGRFYWTPQTPGLKTVTVHLIETLGAGGAVVAEAEATFQILVDDNTLTAPSQRAYIGKEDLIPKANGSEIYQVRGRAYGDGFQWYAFLYNETPDAPNWKRAGWSHDPVDGVDDDLLTQMDLSGYPDGTRLEVALVVQMTSYLSLLSNEIIIDRTAAEGWPVRDLPPMTHAPTLADLDDDGVDEVIAVSYHGSVHVWDIHDASARIETENHYMGTARSGTSVGDVTGDGQPEFVYSTLGGKVVGLKLGTENGEDSLKNAFVFEAPTSDHFRSTPTLADLDGDGDLEVVIATYGSNPSEVYALDYVAAAVDDFTGSLEPMPGWPQVLPANPPEGASHIERQIASSPAVGNLDSDDDLEIIVAGRYRAFAFDAAGNAEWDPQGVLLTDPIDGAMTTGATSPVATSQPAVGDLDNDGNLEVVIGTNVLTAEGLPFSIWPQPAGISSLTAALVDLDVDGDLEIVLGNKAWHHDGSGALGGDFASQGDAASSAVLVDCGHGETAVIQGQRATGQNFILGFDGPAEDGMLMAPYPKVLFGAAEDNRTPVVGDFDDDGMVEVAMSVTDSIYGGIVAVWDLDVPNHDEFHQWPTLGGNNRHTGFYQSPSPNRPLLTQVTASANRVVIKWTDNSSVEAGFLVQRSATGEAFTWEDVAVVDADSTVHSDTPPTPGEWSYRIKAFRPDAFTGEAQVSPPTAPKSVVF